MTFLKTLGILILILLVKLDTKRIELGNYWLHYQTWCINTHLARIERERS